MRAGKNSALLFCLVVPNIFLGSEKLKDEVNKEKVNKETVILNFFVGQQITERKNIVGSNMLLCKSFRLLLKSLYLQVLSCL